MWHFTGLLPTSLCKHHEACACRGIRPHPLWITLCYACMMLSLSLAFAIVKPISRAHSHTINSHMHVCRAHVHGVPIQMRADWMCQPEGQWHTFTCFSCCYYGAAGDVLLTGTPPGVSRMQPGDTLLARVHGPSQQVLSEAHWTVDREQQ